MDRVKGYGMNATIKQYEAAAKRIARLWGTGGSDGPSVVRDWDGAGRHAIIWEQGAPYGWAMLLDGGRDEEFGIEYPPVPAPKGFFFEPYTGYAVGIFKI